MNDGHFDWSKHGPRSRAESDAVMALSKDRTEPRVRPHACRPWCRGNTDSPSIVAYRATVSGYSTGREYER